MPIFFRDSAPSHLFSIPEMDFSEDLFAEPLEGHWFRLASVTIGNPVNARSVRDVTERQSLLLAPEKFETITPQLNSIGKALNSIGVPSESLTYSNDSSEYAYRPFYAFDLVHEVVSEPLAFIGKGRNEHNLSLNPDVPLYFELEEKPHGSCCWWDPQRSAEVIRRKLVDDGHFEFIEIRVDYLLKYLRARQRALVVGHYRHFHFLNPPQSAIEAYVKTDDLILHGSAGAKATVQNWGLHDEAGLGDPFLIRRLHLWFQIEPPTLDMERVFDEEPDFDIGELTLPVSGGAVAPARFRHSALRDGQQFAGITCDFRTHVYFRQEVLEKYQGASGFEVSDDGSVSCGHYWGLVRSTNRVGNELLSTYIGDFAEGVALHEWPHWRQYATEPPAPETFNALAQETPIPKAVNEVASALNRLNGAFRDFTAHVGVNLDEPILWHGSLDSLAGRQMKWVYPASAADNEFLKRATLASTFVIDEINSANMRKFLLHFGPDMHCKGGNTLGSRNLLQRVALVAELIAQLRPETAEIAKLVQWSEDGRGASDADLQEELNRSYKELRDSFSPLAFLYDLRTHGGLAHPPNMAKTKDAAVNLGLPEKNWQRGDFLLILSLVRQAIDAIAERIDGVE